MRGARATVTAAVGACVMGVVVGSGALAAGSDSQPLTGCLTQSGALTGVARGTTPPQPCATGQQQVTWGLPGANGAPGTTGLDGADGIPGSGRLPQEQIVFYDDMSEDQGWSERPRIGWGPDFGDPVLWIGDLIVVKTLSLPEHDTIRVQADVSYFDQWQGEQAYLKVDGRIVWNRIGGCPDQTGCAGVNVAGDDQVTDEVGVNIDVTLPHTASTVTVEFGTTLDSRTDLFDASLAIDNVTMSVGRSAHG